MRVVTICFVESQEGLKPHAVFLHDVVESVGNVESQEGLKLDFRLPRYAPDLGGV